MYFRTLRLGIALAVTIFVFTFFVPIVPYRTQAVCTSMFCGLTPIGGFYTGYNSLGLILFHWGASLDTSFGDSTYVPPIVMMTIGGEPSYLTAFGVSMFILLPLALLIATLLIPEEWRVISAGLSSLRRWRDRQQD